MISVDEIMKRFGVESAFIILILRVYFGISVAKELCHFSKDYSINWDFLQERIYAYEIRPLIYKVLSMNAECVDKKFLTQLKEECFSITAENLERLRETIRLNQILTNHELKAVQFKGVFLSKQLFGDYTSRETCDIDLLIYPEEVKKITTLLLSHDYKTKEDFPDIISDENLKISCDISLIKQNSIYSGGLEIHWQVSPVFYNIHLSNTTLFHDLEIVNISGHPISCLNNESTLLSLLCHHGVNDFWRTIKHVVDLAAFVQQKSNETDWQFLKQQMKILKIEKATKIGLELVSELFGIHVPHGHYPYSYERKIKGFDFVLNNLLQYPMVDRFTFSFKGVMQDLILKDNLYEKFKTLGKKLRRKME